MVVDEIAKRHDIELKTKDAYRIGKGSVEGNDVILLEPLTFMNRSGPAVRKVMAKHGLSPENLTVIHDDIDMETGKLKIRKRGSSGGHKGVESIIESIGSDRFIRVKVGVGRQEGVPVEEYVLGKFRKEETALIKDLLVCAAEAVAVIIHEGADKAMNRFN